MEAVNARHSRRRRGAAMVEMAIILPLLVLMLLGLMEYGWAFFKAAQVNNAARQTARVAVRPDADTAAIEEALDDVMLRAGLADSGYTYAIDPGLNVETGASLTVQVTVPYDSLTGGLVPVPAALVGATTMVKEGT